MKCVVDRICYFVLVLLYCVEYKKMWKKENKGLRFGLVFVRDSAGFYRTMRSINNAIDKPLRLNAQTTDMTTSKPCPN